MPAKGEVPSSFLEIGPISVERCTCIAQSGTEESSSQDLTATEATPKANAPTAVKTTAPVEIAPALKQQGALHTHDLTAGADPSDPDPSGGGDSTDEGDGQEPIPHPWEPHSTTSSTYQR